MVLRGVTVVRDGEEIPPAQIQVSAQPKQEAKAAQSAVKKEEEKPADPRIKYGVMAGVGCVIPLACICGASGIPFSLHRICIGLCSWLLRGLERQPRFTHTTYGGNQCDFRYHHCWVHYCKLDNQQATSLLMH